MKKTLSIALISIFALSILSGCCREHKWVDATCDAPKTCSECGKTEGEKLEHVWAEATCAAPKTCTLCGLTEGEALAHTEGSPANYQSGAICSVCGEEISEKLAPEFETMNVKGSFMELNQVYPYVTDCYEDTTKLTTAEASVTEYERFDSDETHEAKDGYEWIKLTLHLTYSDDNANNYGFRTGTCYEDYYSPKAHDDSIVVLDEESSVATYNANWYGEDYPECICEYGSWDWGDGWVGTTISGDMTTYQLVPKGFDGICIGLRNRNNEWNEGEYIYDVADDNTLFFRCN